MASIRKRNGKWQVRINHNDISVTRTFLNKKDGEAWARLTEADIERNEFVRSIYLTLSVNGSFYDLNFQAIKKAHVLGGPLYFLA